MVLPGLCGEESGGLTMIMERVVYDVKCSRCWRRIAVGLNEIEDAVKEDREASVKIDGKEHTLCPFCSRDFKSFEKGEAAR